MSWGRNVGVRAPVTAEEAQAAVATWEAEQKSIDESYHADEAVVTGHAAQIRGVVALVQEQTAARPELKFKVEAGGHASSDGSGYVNANVTYFPSA